MKLQSNKGYTLIVLLIALLIIGYLVYKMMGDSTGGQSRGGVSRPKAVVDRAQDAAQKANARTRASEDAINDLTR